MGYNLFNTSLKLTMVFSTVFFCQVGIEYLCDKFSVYSNFDDFMKLKNKYSNKLNELFSNIRMLKSFVKEKEEIKKLKIINRRHLTIQIFIQKEYIIFQN